MRHCGNCKFSLKIDSGYSNWTVEGTDIHCLKKLNKDLPADAWYNACQEGEFAEDCEEYKEGKPPAVDVDRERGDLENYSSDPEIKKLLKDYTY